METLPTPTQRKSLTVSDVKNSKLQKQQYEVVEAELVQTQPVASYEVKEIIKPEEVDPMKKRYGRLANIAGSVMAMHNEQRGKQWKL